MLLCCYSHIRKQHSTDVLRPTVICTGHKRKDWRSMCWSAYNTNLLWYSELHCVGILQGMFGRSARITTLSFDIPFAGAMSINQWLTMHIAKLLKQMKHNTWQQLLNRMSDKLKKTEENFLYEIKYCELFHEGIVWNGVIAPRILNLHCKWDEWLNSSPCVYTTSNFTLILTE